MGRIGLRGTTRRRPLTKQPYKRFAAKRPRAKKGRTGGKRRVGMMTRYAAPVSIGTGMTVGKRGPAGIGYSMRQVSDTCTRITGRAYVGEVNTTNKLVTGGKQNCLGLAFDINPSLLNDRVAVIASTFQKYVYQGVKFTYVPQCSTSTGGSVGLVFDRDPLEISANSLGGQFLAEVMSYEHAVLTPAYVENSTSYARDPKELKTWYLGAPDATLTTRETSQGNLLVYVSNADAAKGYGFIVMDYVLDLIAPSLMPNKQNITAITAAPSQWVDCSAASSVSTNASVGTSGAWSISGFAAYPMWDLPAWGALFTGLPKGLQGGIVGEVHLGGTASGVPGNFWCTGGTVVNSNNAIVGDSAAAAKSVFVYGQKLYFCVHNCFVIASGVGRQALTWHTTLASARAAAGMFASIVTGAPAVVSDVIPDCLMGSSAGATVNVGGFVRLIAEGHTTEDTA